MEIKKRPYNFYDGSPPQGPSRGTAGQITGIANEASMKAAAGRPSGRRYIS